MSETYSSSFGSKIFPEYKSKEYIIEGSNFCKIIFTLYNNCPLNYFEDYIALFDEQYESIDGNNYPINFIEFRYYDQSDKSDESNDKFYNYDMSGYQIGIGTDKDDVLIKQIIFDLNVNIDRKESNLLSKNIEQINTFNKYFKKIRVCPVLTRFPVILEK